MPTDSSAQAKDVEFYSSAVTAWFNTALEHVKGVFTLSAGGIGLLVTLLTTVGVGNAALLVLYAAAILAFLVSLIIVLAIFRRNRTYLEQVVVAGNKALDPLLTVLDFAALASFGIGAILTAIIGISTAVSSYSTKERSMAREIKPVVSTETLNKSFNGLANMQPQAPSGTATQVTTPAPAPVAQQSTTSTSPNAGNVNTAASKDKGSQ